MHNPTNTVSPTSSFSSTNSQASTSTTSSEPAHHEPHGLQPTTADKYHTYLEKANDPKLTKEARTHAQHGLKGMGVSSHEKTLTKIKSIFHHHHHDVDHQAE